MRDRKYNELIRSLVLDWFGKYAEGAPEIPIPDYIRTAFPRGL